MLKRIGVALAAVALLLPFQVSAQKRGPVVVSLLAVVVDNSLTQHIKTKTRFYLSLTG